MFNIFKKKEKKQPKFTELFVRVRHKRFGLGFIVAYGNIGYNNIGVRFDKPSGDLGSICGDTVIRGYKTSGNSEWYSDYQLEEVKDFDYNELVTIANGMYNEIGKR